MKSRTGTLSPWVLCSHTHSFPIVHGGFFAVYQQSWVGDTGPQSLKYLLSCSSWKKFSDPYSKVIIAGGGLGEGVSFFFSGYKGGFWKTVGKGTNLLKINAICWENVKYFTAILTSASVKHVLMLVFCKGFHILNGCYLSYIEQTDSKYWVNLANATQ